MIAAALARPRTAVMVAVGVSAWLTWILPAWAAPSIDIEPACIDSRFSGSLTVVGTDFPPGTVQVSLTGLVNPPPPMTATVGAAGTFAVTFPWAAQPAGTGFSVQVQARTLNAGRQFNVVSGTCSTAPDSTSSSSSSSTSSTSTTTVPAVLPGGSPSLVCIPPIGPPGFVTLAVGTGFPPNTPVVLRWQPGIAGARTVTDAKGNLSAPVLVMHHDVLGPRALVAQAGGGLLATTASAPFLVVPATLGPPEVIDPIPQLVFRR